MIEPLVSIITPAYNSERFIEETINSVLGQTYRNWEMIIVDDCSTDKTCEIVTKLSLVDSRIKLIKKNENSGAATSRNIALENSNGRFIAYLDADDIWLSDKLTKQVKFMIDNNYGFSCCSYEVIDSDGNSKNKFIKMKDKVDYMGFLCNNLLQTVGMMADLKIVNRDTLIMPQMRRRQDAATWLQVLKSGFQCYGMKEILAQYRRVEGSLSSNKAKAVTGVWYLYREIEGLNIVISSYCFVRYAFLAVWKRIYI